MKEKVFFSLLAGLLLIAAVLGGLAIIADQAQAGTLAQNVACYMEQGGAKFVASSGCEIEVQSGATFDLQSGASIDFSSGVDLDGANLTIDADGDSILDENTDDNIRLTLGAATGTFSVLTGNGKIGNGTPTTAQDGEDLYVEGMLEVDGTADFDGNSDAVQLAVSGYTTQTNDLAQLNGGLVDIGGGTYGTANGDNDLGVDGDIEANGAIIFGSDGLYPLGYASDGYEIVCGTTDTFTGSTEIDVTALTTATYVLATQITAPITTAAYLHVSDPTTTTITLTSLENDFDAGSTGIAAHYCVVGQQ